MACATAGRHAASAKSTSAPSTARFRRPVALALPAARPVRTGPRSCRCGGDESGNSTGTSGGRAARRKRVKLFGWRLGFAGGEAHLDPSCSGRTQESALQEALRQAGSLDEALELAERALSSASETISSADGVEYGETRPDTSREISGIIKGIDNEHQELHGSIVRYQAAASEGSTAAGQSLDPADSTAVLVALAQLGGARATGLSRSRLKATIQLLISRVGGTIGQYTPSELAGTTWALAKLKRPHAALFQLAAQRVVMGGLLPAFTGEDLSRMLWAFASVGVRAPRVFAAAAPYAAPETERLSGESLVDLLWAFASASPSPVSEPIARVFDAAAEPALRYAKSGTPRPTSLASLLWAFCKAGVPAPELFAATTAKLTKDAVRLKPAALARLACAAASAQDVPDSDRSALLEAVQMAAIASVAKFSPTELADLAAGFAKGGQPSPALFAAVAQQATSAVPSLKPKQLVMLASAFAAAGYVAPKLYTALRTRAVDTIDRFTPNEMTEILWAFATCRVDAPDLFEAVREHMDMYIHGYLPKQLANTAWAYAATNQEGSTDVLDSVENQALTCIDAFSTDDVANTLWAFAKMGHSAPHLFDAAQQQVVSRLGEFSSGELITILWSYVACCADPDRSFLDLLAHRIDIYRSQLTTEDLCNLARVELAVELRHPDSPPLLPKALRKTVMQAWDSCSSKVAV